MTARIVADIGNSRIKWGLCRRNEIEVVVVASDNESAWDDQCRSRGIGGECEWAIAGVQPVMRDRLARWLRARGSGARIIDDCRQLPIRVAVDHPERVGIDRLLNAVAALARVPAQVPIIIIDAGSAVTVDLVDRDAVFRGGAIFPGLRLMARSLHQETALLPNVSDFESHAVPGLNTEAAIRAGVFDAVCGGIDRLVERMSEGISDVRVMLAGGDVALASELKCRPELVGPVLTLEGIRIAAWPES